MLYAFFWVIRRRLNFVCRRSETLAYKIQTLGNYPEENIQLGFACKICMEFLLKDEVQQEVANHQQRKVGI
jgi:hypothetical protein